MHICHEEILGVFAVFGEWSFIARYYLFLIRQWFHRRKECPHADTHVQLPTDETSNVP